MPRAGFKQVNRVSGNSAPSARRVIAPWTPEEDAKLKSAYAPNGGGETSAAKRLPGRTMEAIRSRACRLKLSRARWWTADDIERLRSMWGIETVENIARMMRRNRNAVVDRARHLGLTIGIPDGWESMSAASVRTGYPLPCLRTILRWSEVRIVKQFTRYTKGKIPKCIVETSEVDYAVHEWHQTETLAAAAERIDWSRIRLLEALKRAGCEPPKRTQGGDKRSHLRLPSADVDKAVAAEAAHRARTWSLVEIRSHLRIASVTAVKWLREAGWVASSRYERVPHEKLCEVVASRLGSVNAVHVTTRQRSALGRLPMSAEDVRNEKRRRSFWSRMEDKGWIRWDGDTLRRTHAGDKASVWSHVPRKYRQEILDKLAARTRALQGEPANTVTKEARAA